MNRQNSFDQKKKDVDELMFGKEWRNEWKERQKIKKLLNRSM